MSLGTVYLLDDEEDMLDILSDMVEGVDLFPVRYDRAKNIFADVTAIEKSSLMVLDLNMPEMDGIEVMRRLAKMTNPPALILISGHDIGVLHSSEKLGRAHNLNIIGSLDKPFQLDRFQQLLYRFCATFGEVQQCERQTSESEVRPDELLHGLENNEMVLYYQPQFSMDTGGLVGCEALIRWMHPGDGLIYPDKFISIAERQGWMDLLTGWVIKQALKQELIWNELDITVPVSINISAHNITSLEFPEQVSELLAAENLTPGSLTLEVTESALMGELVTSLDILTRLRLKGVGLSIDDFGTGYSSLSQLHRVPFSELKIDRSFVISMLVDEEAKAIVKTCIMLGHELKMLVVAEGVESRAHLELLREMGCDIAQGYFCQRPMPAAAMTEFLLAEKNISEKKYSARR